jgi:hypothetical protein
MGDKGIGKGGWRVGTCIVENGTKLWKAVGARKRTLVGSD